MRPFKIDTREEYDYCKSRGIEPLTDRRFKMSIALRVEIQRELFGSGHTPSENEKFYRWCWEHSLQNCEECMRPLRNYSAVYVSHILTRGAHPEMAHDVRNVNVLCFAHHNQWEHATTRRSMRIYTRNLGVVAELKDDYEKLR